MHGPGRLHRAGVFSRDRRSEMLCGECMAVARREDRRENIVLYLMVAALIVVLSMVEMCVTRST